MTHPQSNQDSANLQQEVRLGRKFSLADAIGQEAGNFMKGESPVPRLVQAKGQVRQGLMTCLEDRPGALYQVLLRWIDADDRRISQHITAPNQALQELLQDVLNSPETLYELVRQADVLWGQLYDERPHFQQPGQAPHPDDEYTHESVRTSLKSCLQKLGAKEPTG